MKKEYIAPSVISISLNIERSLLAASGFGGETSGVYHDGPSGDGNESGEGGEYAPITAKTNDDLWVEDDDE